MKVCLLVASPKSPFSSPASREHVHSRVCHPPRKRLRHYTRVHETHDRRHGLDARLLLGVRPTSYLFHRRLVV